jgi:hypothetical protein
MICSGVCHRLAIVMIFAHHRGQRASDHGWNRSQGVGPHAHGTDLSLLTQADLDAVARSLNNRPRKRLDFMKPSERLADLLAMTG